jgi:hypothetical protein
MMVFDEAHTPECRLYLAWFEGGQTAHAAT